LSAILLLLTRYSANNPQFPVNDRLLFTGKSHVVGASWPERPARCEHRVDFCLSYDGCIEPNPYDVVEGIIPTMRCAMARDVGSRLDNQAAWYLFYEWLPRSGEEMAAWPWVFHYVNVGPSVKEHEAITDVYLPLK
jgi:DNA gyrase inhibitor GyrI